jgi:flagellar biosynthesis anti-sigma factor FlgM
MNLHIHNQAQPVDSSSNLKSSPAQPASGDSKPVSSVVGATQDTASISSLSSQLSSGFAVRQDKVNMHHAQLVNGTYSVDARAVATAMLDDHFLS